MKRTEDSRWNRGGPPRPRPRSRVPGAARYLLIACLALLLASRTGPEAVEPLREAILTLTRPALDAVSETSGNAIATAARLWSSQARTDDRARVDDVAALTAKRDELERENRALRSLVPVAGSKALKLKAASVIGGSAGGMASTLLIAAGQEDGIKAGYPVMIGDRLAGRVHRVHAASAVVVRLSDQLSRVPVFVGAGETRAILVGSGDGAAVLELLGQGPPPLPGDVVTTSGIGGVFPRGLLIGTLIDAPRSLRIVPDAEREYAPVVGVLHIEGATFYSDDQPSFPAPPVKQAEQHPPPSPRQVRR